MASRKNRAAHTAAVNAAVAETSAPVTQEVPVEQVVQESGAAGTVPVIEVTPAASQAALVLKAVNKKGNHATYAVPGTIASVRVSKSAVTNETFPKTFPELLFKQPNQAKLDKLAKRGVNATNAVERAKVLEARIVKANTAAQKNRDKLARLQKRLAPAGAAQAATETAAAGSETVAVATAQEATEAAVAGAEVAQA